MLKIPGADRNRSQEMPSTQTALQVPVKKMKGYTLHLLSQFKERINHVCSPSLTIPSWLGKLLQGIHFTLVILRFYVFQFLSI